MSAPIALAIGLVVLLWLVVMAVRRAVRRRRRRLGRESVDLNVQRWR